MIVADQDADALGANGSQWTGTFAADLATSDGMDPAIGYVLESFGRAPDILIDNLGVGNSGSFADISDEQWARSFDVNLMGTVRACRAPIPKMAERGSAAVVNNTPGRTSPNSPSRR